MTSGLLRTSAPRDRVEGRFRSHVAFMGSLAPLRWMFVRVQSEAMCAPGCRNNVVGGTDVEAHAAVEGVACCPAGPLTSYSKLGFKFLDPGHSDLQSSTGPMLESRSLTQPRLGFDEPTSQIESARNKPKDQSEDEPALD